MKLKYALTALALGLGTSFAGAQQLANGLLPVDTQIQNQAFLDTTDNGGNPSTTASNVVTAIVAPVTGVLITPDTNTSNLGNCGQSIVALPGARTPITYTMTNTGNMTQGYTMTTVSALAAGSTSAVADSTPTVNEIYRESNGTPGLQTGTGGDTGSYNSSTAPGQIVLAPGESTTIYMVIQTPADAGGDSVYGASPSAVSQQDTTQVDNQNLGCLITARVLNLDMTQAPAQTANTPDTKVFTHVLTNTGNYPLNWADVSVDQSGTNYPVTFTASANGYTSPPQTSAEQAIRLAVNNGYGGSYAWFPGQQVTLTDTYSVPAGEPNGAVNDENLRPYINVASDIVTGGRTQNNLPQSAATDHHDIINVIGAGAGQIVKTQSDCGTNTTAGCASTADMRANPGNYQSNISVKSCDIIKYGLFASNAGPGNLYAPIIRDVIPANMQLLYTNPLYGANAPHIFRVGGGAWQTINAGQNDTQQQGPGALMEFGFDSSNDGNITAADILPVGVNMGVTIYAQVAGPNCTNPFTPGSNWEELP